MDRGIKSLKTTKGKTEELLVSSFIYGFTHFCRSFFLLKFFLKFLILNFFLEKQTHIKEGKKNFKF